MDVFDVTIKANIYVLANNREEAEEIAKKELGDISVYLPVSTPDFSFDAYRTPNQEDYLKKRAINHDA